MSPALLRLLGTPVLSAPSGDVPLAPERRFQLLAHLAVQASWVTRDQLAALFWPDRDQEHARGNLRFTLTQLRKLPWVAGLEARADALRWDVDTDLKRFERAIYVRDHTNALELYAGPLLVGFDAQAPEPFLAWLHAERRRLHARWREAAIERLVGNGDPVDRIALAVRLLQDDPLDEPVLQTYVRLLHAAGRATEAQRSLREFGQRLAEELGIEPSAETRALLRSLAVTSLAAPDASPAKSEPGADFVGREAERMHLASLLARDDVRLVTLLGPGGIGKSRLARQVRDDLAPSFAGTIGLVPLEDVQEPDGIGARIARELGLRLQGAASAIDQVVDRLRRQPALLLLDNFEQLAPGAWVLADLLARCPSLRLLVTSRVRLHLTQELMLPLDGLPCPLPEDEDRAGDFDAVRLFIQRAHQTRSHFDPQPQLADIAEICRLVDGMPLAIELTAAWTRLLTCRAIADEIRAGSELLRAEDPSRPPRQASVEATLVHSWQMLVLAERNALTKLSVFRGGFVREAAREVAGASLPILASLADKSLLKVEKDRFSLHPLVLRFAAEKLSQQAAVASRHRDWFAHRSVGLRADWRRHPHEILTELDADLSNYRAAWTNAIESGDLDAAARMAWPLKQYFKQRASPFEGVQWMLSAIEHPLALPAPTRPLADLHAHAADLLLHAGRESDCQLHARSALKLYARVKDTLAATHCLTLIGMSLVNSGRFREAEPFLARAHKRAADSRDDEALAMTCANLSNLHSTLGNRALAREYLEQALALNRRLGNAAALQVLLNNLGNLHRYERDFGKAKRCFEEALAVCERHGLLAKRCFPLVNLGTCLLEEGQLTRAADILDEAIRSAQTHASRPVELAANVAAARVDVRRGLPDAALERIARALKLSAGVPPEQLHAIGGLADVACTSGHASLARRCWRFVARHPGTHAETRDEALHRLDETASIATNDREPLPDAAAGLNLLCDELLAEVRAACTLPPPN